MNKKSSTEQIKIIRGGLAVDDRGTLKFVNEFDFNAVKRFYQVENHQVGFIRAFHGHLKEGKYVYVSTGSIILYAVPLTNTKRPSKKAVVERHVLSSKSPLIVYIPPGYANGFKTLEEDTQVIFFSTSTLEESKGDDYRFPYDYWGKEIWEVEYR